MMRVLKACDPAHQYVLLPFCMSYFIAIDKGLHFTYVENHFDGQNENDIKYIVAVASAKVVNIKNLKK